MNLPYLIARRYLFSKGNRNVINIISAIATSGVAIGSFAMIIILSAFNGLETLVTDMYTSFDPDMEITPKEGKTLSLGEIPLEEIQKWPEVVSAAPILEETVFLQYQDQQSIVTLKGVPEKHLPYLGLDTHLIEGEFALDMGGAPGAIVGYGIADNLSLYVSTGFETIKVYAANRNASNAMNPMSKFISKNVVPTGIVAVNPEFDFTYFITSFDFATELLQYENRASHIELKLKASANPSDVKDKLMELLGEEYDVKSRIELNDVIYKTHETEKWITFFILSFVLIVATFNLIGSLTMLIIDKHGDTNLLRSLGCTIKQVQRLFLLEGILITAIGVIIGLGLGITLVLLQQHVGLYALPGGIVEYYPVEFRFMDVLAVSAVVLLIGYLASSIPVRLLLNPRSLQTMTD